MNDDTSAMHVQRSVQHIAPDAPSEELPSSGRGPDGRFQKGNVEALKHGDRSMRVAAGLMPTQAEAVAIVHDRISAIQNDLGGPDALSALMVGQVQRHARLELVEAHLWSNLERNGLTTGKGATRAAATLWLQVVDRLQKSATTLGLERRAKSIRDMSITEWLESTRTNDANK